MATVATHPATRQTRTGMPGTLLSSAASPPLAIPPQKRANDAQNGPGRPESPELLFDMSPDDHRLGSGDDDQLDNDDLNALNGDDHRSLHSRFAAHRRDSGLPPSPHVVPSRAPSSIFQNTPPTSSAGARSYQHPRGRPTLPPSSSYYPGANGTPRTQPAEPPLMYSFPTFRLSTRAETAPKPRYGAPRPTREPSPPFAPPTPAGGKSRHRTADRPDPPRRRRSSSASTSSFTASSKDTSADTSAATSISASPDEDEYYVGVGGGGSRALAVRRADKRKGSAETVSSAGLSAALRRTHLSGRSPHQQYQQHPPPPPSAYGQYGSKPVSGLSVEMGVSRSRPTQWSNRASAAVEQTSEWVKVSGSPPQSVRSRAAEELQRLSRGRVR